MYLGARQPLYRSLFGYLTSILLIPLYVSLFPAYKWVSSRLGEGAVIFLPVVLTVFACCLLVVVIHFHGRLLSRENNYALLGAGLLVCLLSLLIPDPALPAKRIHVLEYMALSLVVRYAMSFYHQGTVLLVFTIIFTALLGIHDEFLQGLHPDRTYGLRDMTVNGVAGLGGALIWHGARLFESIDLFPVKNQEHTQIWPGGLCLCFLCLSIAGLIWPISFYRSLPVPLWPVLPLLAVFVCYLLFVDRFGPLLHGVSATCLMAVTLTTYPMVCHVFQIAFY